MSSAWPRDYAPPPALARRELGRAARVGSDVRRWAPLSLLLHAALVLAPARGASRAGTGEGEARRAVSFELAVDARAIAPSSSGDDGKTREGLPTRPTGEPDTHTAGRAGTRAGDRGREAHQRGAESEDRLTTAVDARHLADTLGALLHAAAPAGPTLGVGVESPDTARGSRDEATLGLAPSGAFVSPGTRGLDMTGTGRGSGPRGEHDGTIGARALGLGSLGASHRDALRPRPHWREDVCVTMEQGCPVRRMRLVIAVEVLAGPLAPSDARRVVHLGRARIVVCPPTLPMRIELVTAADGRVPTARATPPVPCVEAALAALRFPSSSGPSRVRVTLRLAYY